jgi:ribonuclease HII
MTASIEKAISFPNISVEFPHCQVERNGRSKALYRRRTIIEDSRMVASRARKRLLPADFWGRRHPECNNIDALRDTLREDPLGKEIDHIISRPMKEIREYVLGLLPPVPEAIIHTLSKDHRKTVRFLAAHLQKVTLGAAREKERLHKMMRYERDLFSAGYRVIAGVDEAGVAPLAGPVVAAAAILPRAYFLKDLNDSKKILASEKREKLATQLKQDAICWACGFAEPGEIDRWNIYRASLLAMSRAVNSLAKTPDFILVDARTIPHCPVPQKAIVHGDALSASIAAASLIAKTTRDRHMCEMDKKYPGYGFASHKGYPTPDHIQALREMGPLPIHRRSFGPVRKSLGIDPRQKGLFAEFDPEADL